LERGIKGLSNGISFVWVGYETEKLLRVKFDNLGYFWDLMASVTFITYLIARVTLSFWFDYVSDCSGYFWLPV